MQTIKIAHLYYDLLNLYGENGNVLALVHHLEKQNLKVVVSDISLNDKIDFNAYDIFYMGSGEEENIDLIYNDLLEKKEDLKQAILKNKFFIVTGNALELFGKDKLQIFDYYTEHIPFRIVGEQKMQFALLKEEIIGFQNRESVIKNCQEKSLFTVLSGCGYQPKVMKEGFRSHNFLATYLLGPLLIRNPHFTEYIVKELLTSLNIKYTPYVDTLEVKAYKEYEKNGI